MIDEILSRLRDAPTEDERFWVALEFNLRTKNPFVQEAIWAAAIPHWFEGDFLGWLLGWPDFGAGPEYKAFINLPFVETFSERGYNIHERTRALCLDRLWKQNRFRYQELSQRAYEYCSRYVEQDEFWLVEAIYHGVMANISEAHDIFIHKCAEWNHHFEYSKLEMLIRPVLEAAETGKLTGRIVGWALYYQARLLVIYHQRKQARRILEQALSQADGDIVLRSYCLKSLGGLHLGELARPKLMGQQMSQTRRVSPVLWRFAIGIATVIMLFLVSGTVFAQQSLPGDALYNWKLTSEYVWRLTSPDPLAVDLTLSNRRMNELVWASSSGDEVRLARAINNYEKLLIKFYEETDEEDRERILPVLRAQHEALVQAGVSVPELDAYFPR